MKKSDNYGNSSLILFITTGLIMFILAIVTKDKNAKTIFIIAGFSNIILGYIEMGIITIKKYIDKVFEDKVRNIQHADIRLTETLKVLKDEEEVEEND